MTEIESPISQSDGEINEAIMDEWALIELLKSLKLLDNELDKGLLEYANLNGSEEDRAEELLALITSLDMKLIKEEVLLETICEVLHKKSVELEEKAVREDDPVSVLIAGQYRELANALIKKARIIQDEENNNNSKIEKVSKRRNFFGAAALAVAGTVAIGAPKAHAASGDAAIIAELALIKGETAGIWGDMKTNYQIFLKELKGITDLMGGLNSIHNAFINGISGLLKFEGEENAKKIATHVTVGQNIIDALNEQNKLKNKMGNGVPAGACSSDSAVTAADKLDEKANADKKAAVTAAIVGAVTGSGDEEEEKAAKKTMLALTKEKGIEALNGDASATEPATTVEEKNNKALASYHLTSEASSVLNQDLTKVFNSKEGIRYVAAAAKRVARRTLAIGVIEGQSARNMGDSDSYEFLKKRLDAVGVVTAEQKAAKSNEGEVKFQSDKKMVAYGKEVSQLLEKMGGANKEITAEQVLEFQVTAKNNPTYFEYVRGTGFGSPPLLRELIDHSSLSLKIQHNAYLEQKKQTSLLATLLLEMMDDPARIAIHNDTYTKALK
jgi:hypothetical protein